MRLPGIIAHADWSWTRRGRVACVARRDGTGRYLASIEPVAAEAMLAGIMDRSDGEGAFLGVDFPIGLPEAYARQRGITHFPSFLAGLDPDDPFFRPAERPEEISPARPFYPARPGGATRARLLAGHGLAWPEGYRQLLRRCDVATNASCLFWTLGPQQCGKAALAGWRELLVPALRQDDMLAIWPFDGRLTRLLDRRGLVVAETYPGSCYRRLGLHLPFAKTSREARQAQAPVILTLAASLEVAFDAELAAAIAAGFPDPLQRDHAFDAVIGCLAMAASLRSPALFPEPEEPAVRMIEGWMLGLARRL